MDAKKILNSGFVRFISPPEQIGGLEISDESIKFAYLFEKKGILEWEHFTEKPLPAGIIVNGIVKNREALAQEIKQTFDLMISNKKISKEVIVCIPESNLYIQKLSLPSTLEEKIIPYVVMNNPSVTFPFPLGDIYLGWQTIAIEGLERKIIATLGQKEMINPYIWAVEKAGLKMIALQTPSLGFGLILNIPKDIALIYYFEKKTYSITAYLNGKPFYKYTVAQSEKSKPPADTEAVTEIIAKNFARMQDFTLTELGEGHEFSIVILSNVFDIGAIGEMLKKRGLPVSQPMLAKTNVPKNILNLPSWLGALGAAVRGIMPRRDDKYASLLPFSTQEQYLTRKRNFFFSRTIKIIFTTFLLYIGIFIAIGMFASSNYNSAAAELQKIKSINLPPELIETENEMNRFNAAVDKTLQIKDSLKSILPAFKAIKKLALPGIAITSFNSKTDKSVAEISLNGTAETRKSLLDFQKFMEQDGNFKEINIPLQNLEQKQNINFTLSFKYDI